MCRDVQGIRACRLASGALISKSLYFAIKRITLNRAYGHLKPCRQAWLGHMPILIIASGSASAWTQISRSASYLYDLIIVAASGSSTMPFTASLPAASGEYHRRSVVSFAIVLLWGDGRRYRCHTDIIVAPPMPSALYSATAHHHMHARSFRCHCTDGRRAVVTHAPSSVVISGRHFLGIIPRREMNICIVVRLSRMRRRHSEYYSRWPRGR